MQRYQLRMHTVVKRQLMKNRILYLLIVCSCSIYAQNQGDSLFDDSYLHEIRFTDVDTLEYIDNKMYQLARVSIDGNVVDSIGFKRKGNISGYPETNKYGIKVKSNKYVSGQKYDGIKEWTLHMNYQDPTMLREKLTYDLCQELGLYSLRTAFAKVYINDVYWGVFTIVEGKDEMYKHVFDHRDMDAIESIDFGDMCYIDDNVDSYFDGFLPAYLVENGNAETAQNRFLELLDVANNTADSDYITEVEKVFNLRDFMTYQALNVALLNFDSYIGFNGNQIYVYDTLNTIWQVTPWDFNASFGLWDTNNATIEDYPFIPSDISNGCIASRLNDIPEMRSYYLEAMCNINRIFGNSEEYFSKIDDLAEQIRDAVYQDTRKVTSNEEFENGLGYEYQNVFGELAPGLKELVSVRSEIIMQGLANESYNCTSYLLFPECDISRSLFLL